MQRSFAALSLTDVQTLYRFYASRDFRAVWLGRDCRARMHELQWAIDEAASHGLNPNDYHARALLASPTCSWQAELLASDGWMKLAGDLFRGRVDQGLLEPDWNLQRPAFDAVQALQQAVSSGDAVLALQTLAPQDHYYAALRLALQRFRSYALRGGWIGIDEGPSLRLGDRGIRVDQLRARLALSGLLASAAATPGLDFDTTLEQAVMAFQRRANLEPDGAVGRQTLAQLNRRALDRIAQLRANLERWRWLHIPPGERHLRVNIADFRLEAWDQQVLEREHRVIVGSLYRSTPSFSGRISRIVFAPWWEVPRRLAVQDKLPLFRRDPGAFERLGFELLDRSGAPVDARTVDWNKLHAEHFPYRLRQRPGPLNALGQVKILFPNAHDVYLHDTPSRGLFARVRRDFSSGCIRVEQALELSEWLLADMPEWTRERIDRSVATAAEVSAIPARKVPVYIIYRTISFDDDGSVRFLNDLYDRDTALLAALDARSTAQERR
jgi:murein L,D-transpeptidase YcbB/YkuD